MTLPLPLLLSLLAMNKKFLPTVKGEELYETGMIHQGAHLKSVRDYLKERMTEVLEEGKLKGYTQEQYRKELINIINEERELLEKGIRALNKNKQPHAIDLPKTTKKE